MIFRRSSERVFIHYHAAWRRVSNQNKESREKRGFKRPGLESLGFEARLARLELRRSSRARSIRSVQAKNAARKSESTIDFRTIFDESFELKKTIESRIDRFSTRCYFLGRLGEKGFRNLLQASTLHESTPLASAGASAFSGSRRAFRPSSFVRIAEGRDSTNDRVWAM